MAGRRSVERVLPEPTRDLLLRYAQFLDDTVEYVLQQLIDTTMAKDRDFVAWCAEHEADPLPSPNRRRKAVTPRASIEARRS